MGHLDVQTPLSPASTRRLHDWIESTAVRSGRILDGYGNMDERRHRLAGRPLSRMSLRTYDTG